MPVLCALQSASDKPGSRLLLDVLGCLSCQLESFNMLRIHPYTNYFILNFYQSAVNMRLSTHLA